MWFWYMPVCSCAALTRVYHTTPLYKLQTHKRTTPTPNQTPATAAAWKPVGRNTDPLKMSLATPPAAPKAPEPGTVCSLVFLPRHTVRVCWCAAGGWCVGSPGRPRPFLHTCVHVGGGCEQVCGGGVRVRDVSLGPFPCVNVVMCLRVFSRVICRRTGPHILHPPDPATTALTPTTNIQLLQHLPTHPSLPPTATSELLETYIKEHGGNRVIRKVDAQTCIHTPRTHTRHADTHNTPTHTSTPPTHPQGTHCQQRHGCHQIHPLHAQVGILRYALPRTCTPASMHVLCLSVHARILIHILLCANPHPYLRTHTQSSETRKRSSLSPWQLRKISKQMPRYTCVRVL